ncbi:MAG: hypothetical protein U0946_01610 [Patescibacteria group bacterium]|nr:hypothetical protein [Patescibacteria group bacterium]
MTYQILTCPNCQGRGCPTCQNTGKVRVAEKEMQKLKQMMGQFSSAPQTSPTFNQPIPPSSTNSQNSTNLAGIIAFSILSILAGGAAASWYFLKTFKPFFAVLIALFTLIGAKFTLNQPFFQLQEPDDFLKAIKSKT